MLIEIARRRPAAILTVSAILIFLLCLAVIPIDQSPNGEFASEVIRQYQLTESRDQLQAYAITLLAVLIFSAVIFVLALRGTISLSDNPSPYRLGAATCIGFSIVGVAIYSFWEPRWLIVDVTIVFALFALFVVAAPKLSSRTIDLSTTAAIGAYLTTLVAPGFLVNPIPLMAADPDALSQFEMHLLSLTMPGHEIAAGLNFFDQVPLAYGMLSPSIMSVIDHFEHNMTLGNQLHFVQVWQFLFCVLAVSAYFSFRSRNLLGILLAIMLAGPYWATAGLGIWHPNQTGLRSIGLPLGILAIAIAGRLDATRAAWWLGGIAAIAALSNIETSVAVLAGFALYFVVRTRTIPIRLAIHTVSALICALIVYLVVYRIALGRLPFSLSALRSGYNFGGFGIATNGQSGLRLFSRGADSENLYIVPFALIMLGHAIYVVISGFMKLGHRKLTQYEAMKVAIAAILLVWLSYYLNSPNWWQIWTHLFLYGFLVIDVMDRRLFGIGLSSKLYHSIGPLRHLCIAPARFVLVFLLGFMIVHTNQNLIQYTAGFMYPDWIKLPHEASLVSDILLPKVMADALRTKASALEILNSSAKGNLVYLTFNAGFMPELTGFFERYPAGNLWWTIRGDNDFPRVMKSIVARHPEMVLIDAPTGPLAVTGERKKFENRVRDAIGQNYHLSSTEDGWQVWRPQ